MVFEVRRPWLMTVMAVKDTQCVWVRVWVWMGWWVRVRAWMRV